jgi:hypothetical protein
MKDFLTTPSRVKQITPMRIAYAAGFVMFFLITEIGRKIYRPWVYENGISDWGIADTIGNSMGTLTQIFFSLAILHATRIQAYRVAAFITCGYILYEVLQPYLPRGVFDPGDIYATIGAGFVALIIISIMHRAPGHDKILFPGSATDSIKAPTVENRDSGSSPE